jgi:DNA-binding PadR family transcriptional regulator
MNNPALNLIGRLEKDAKGSFVFILILAIIHTEQNTWGYQIKKKLQMIMNSEQEINDSTLYTTLRNLEKNYGYVTSEFVDKRRIYHLSEFGKEHIAEIYTYWMKFLEQSILIFEMLGIEIPKTLRGVIE